MKKTFVLTGCIFVLSFLFRLWFAARVPQPFVYDQDEYYGYALGIIKDGLHADIYRLYGYPLLVTPLIWLFGIKSPLPWTVFNAVLDSVTAVMVFSLVRKISRNNVLSVLGGVAYGLNPFTSGYVGVLLSEVTTIFLVTLSAWLMVLYQEKRKVRLLLILVFVLGYLPQVRPAFVYFSSFIALLLFIGYVIKPSGSRAIILALVVLLYCLPYTYNVTTNLIHYHEFATLSVDRVFEREFYTSLFIDRGIAFTDTSWGQWPPEAMEAWGAFSRPKNKEGRDLVAKHYMAIALSYIQRDPKAYIFSRIRKSLYVWEKHFVYPYVMGPMSTVQKFAVYWGNIVLVVLGISGMLLTVARKKRVSSALRLLGWYGICLVVYISLVHVVSTSEERFSLPAYPMLYVFGIYTLSLVWKLGRKDRI